MSGNHFLWRLAVFFGLLIQVQPPAHGAVCGEVLWGVPCDPPSSATNGAQGVGTPSPATGSSTPAAPPIGSEKKSEEPTETRPGHESAMVSSPSVTLAVRISPTGYADCVEKVNDVSSESRAVIFPDSETTETYCRKYFPNTSSAPGGPARIGGTEAANVVSSSPVNTPSSHTLPASGAGRTCFGEADPICF